MSAFGGKADSRSAVSAYAQSGHGPSLRQVEDRQERIDAGASVMRAESCYQVRVTGRVFGATAKLGAGENLIKLARVGT
jgi:hypothetical protein